MGLPAEYAKHLQAGHVPAFSLSTTHPHKTPIVINKNQNKQKIFDHCFFYCVFAVTYRRKQFPYSSLIAT
jgi:hypothetical protein